MKLARNKLGVLEMRATTTLLISLIMLACSQVQAQGRPFPESLTPIEKEAAKGVARLDAAARANRIADLDAWLRRLVGQYRIDGSVIQGRTIGYSQTTKPRGVADCILVGKGPGVQCMVNVTWGALDMDMTGPINTTRPAMSDAYNTLKPMMMLFGLDHESAGIQLYSVDQTGDAKLGRLIYSKEDLIYNSHCLPRTEHCIEFMAESNCDGEFTHCFPRIVMVARPGARTIEMDLHIPSGGEGRISLRLHRETEAQKETAR